MKALLDVRVDTYKARIAQGVQTHDVLVLIDDGERVAVVNVEGKRQIKFVDQRKRGQWKHAPSNPAVGTVPRQRAGPLCAVHKGVQSVIKDGVGARRGVAIGKKKEIAFPEGVLAGELDRVITAAAGVG